MPATGDHYPIHNSMIERLPLPTSLTMKSVGVIALILLTSLEGVTAASHAVRGRSLAQGMRFVILTTSHVPLMLRPMKARVAHTLFSFYHHHYYLFRIHY